MSARGAGHTLLVKLFYLTDLEARRILGRPVSEFDYHWHHNGPWDTDFFAARAELKARGLCDTSEIVFDVEKTKKMVIDAGEAIEVDFTAAERHILSYVAATYKDVPLEALLRDVVYETPPMREVKEAGDQLPMGMVDNLERLRVGFELEEMLEAEEAALSGDFVLAEEFFDGLHAEVASANPGAN